MSSQNSWNSTSNKTENIYSQEQIIDIYNKLNNNGDITIDSSAALENSSRVTKISIPPSVELINNSLNKINNKSLSNDNLSNDLSNDNLSNDNNNNNNLLSLDNDLIDPLSTNWYYTDLNGIQQGPFSSLIMQQWYTQNLLTENLSVRRDFDNNWLTINQLWEILKSLSNFQISLAPFNHSLPKNLILPINKNSIPSHLSSFNNTLNNSQFFKSNNSNNNTLNNTPILDNIVHLDSNNNTTNNNTLDSRSNSNYNSSFMNPINSINNNLNNFNSINNNFNNINNINSINSINNLNPLNNINSINMLNYLNMDINNNLNPSNYINPLLNPLNSINNLAQINSINSPFNSLSMNLDSRSNSQCNNLNNLDNSFMTDLSHLNNTVDQLVPKSNTIDNIEQLQPQIQSQSQPHLEQGQTLDDEINKIDKHIIANPIKQIDSIHKIINPTIENIPIEKTSNFDSTSKQIDSQKYNNPISINSDNDLETHMKLLEIENKEKQKQELKLKQQQRQQELIKEAEEIKKQQQKEQQEREKEEINSINSTSSLEKKKSDIAPWASISKTIKPTKTLEEIQKEEKLKKERELQERKKLEESDRLLASKLALEDSILPTVNINNKKKIISLSELNKLNSNSNPNSNITLPSNSTWAINGGIQSSSKLPIKSLDEIQKEQAEALAAVKHQKSIADAIANQQKQFVNSIANENSNSNSIDNAWTIVNKKDKLKPSIPTPTISKEPQLKNSALNPSSLRSVSSSNTTTTATTTNTTATPTYSAPTVPSVSLQQSFPPPVIEFLNWSRIQLKGLYSTVNKDDVLSIMMQLPIGSETQEIIADTIYSNSSTMDGRRFANEFMKRRGKIEETIRKRGWAFDWFEALEGTKNLKPSSNTSTKTNINSSSSINDDDWDGAFTVVSRKKGRKGN